MGWCNYLLPVVSQAATFDFLVKRGRRLVRCTGLRCQGRACLSSNLSLMVEVIVCI
jgi:hypothetical protein